MLKNIQIATKINYIFISLETLDTYGQNQIQTDIFSYYYCRPINDNMKHEENITNLDIYDLIKSKQIITFLKKLYTLLSQEHIQKIATYILQDFCKKHNSVIVDQYFLKFQYVYTKRKYDYKHPDYYDYNYSTIKKIAMESIYIIYQIGKRKNFYYLLKYFDL